MGHRHPSSATMPQNPFPVTSPDKNTWPRHKEPKKVSDFVSNQKGNHGNAKQVSWEDQVEVIEQRQMIADQSSTPHRLEMSTLRVRKLLSVYSYIHPCILSTSRCIYYTTFALS